MIPCSESAFERSPRRGFGMVVSASSPYSGGRAGGTITSACIVYIAWKGGPPLRLSLRSKRPRRNRTAAHRLDRPVLSNIHQCWKVRRSGMDFVADQLFDGRKIRALTIVDNYSRQCVAIHVGQSLKGEDVVAVMNQLKVIHLAVPERIQVDNGSEFIRSGGPVKGT